MADTDKPLPPKQNQGDLQNHIDAAHDALDHKLGPQSSAQYQAARAEWTAVEKTRKTGADTSLPSLTIAHTADNQSLALITNDKTKTAELIDATGDIWKTTDGLHFADAAGHQKLLQPQKGAGDQPVTDTSGQPTYSFAPEGEQRAKTAVTDAIAAMHRDTTFGVHWSSTDPETMKRTLMPLNADETKQFLAEYKKQTGADFLDELKGRIGDGVQFRTIEALTQRRDGETNDAGNAMVALRTAGDNPAKGSALLRGAVGSLTAAQFQQMEKDFKERYGTSLDEAIKNNPAMSQMDRDLIPFYRKGVKDRTAEDIKDMAKIVMNQFDADKKDKYGGPIANDYLKAFSDVMGGDTDAAKKARADLRDDKAFCDRYNKAFADHYTVSDTARAVAGDLLAEGRISLKTIVQGDKNVLGGLMDNNRNIDLALQKASPEERANYVLGGQIQNLKDDPQFRQTEETWMKANATPADQKKFNELLQRIDSGKLTPEEQQAVDYHQSLYTSFGKFGNPREQSIWDDEMSHGRKTVVSSMAETHGEAFLGMFGGGHTTQDLMSKLEQMPKEDYQLLSNPVTAAQEREELATSLKTYASDKEQERALKLFDQKAEAAQKGVSYEDSQQLRRSFAEVVGDNPSNPQAIVEAMQHMNKTDVDQLLANKDLHKTLESMFATQTTGTVGLNAAITYLGQSLLSQMDKTHAPAQLTAIDKLASEVLASGGKPPADRAKRLEDIYEIMKDPALRAKMQQMEQLGANDLRQVNFSSSDNALFNLLREGTPPVDGVSMKGYGETAWETLLAGQRPLSSEERQLRDKYIDPQNNTLRNIYGNYEAIAALPDSVRGEVYGRMSPEQQKLLDHVAKNGGKMDLVDRAYSYAIGDGGNARDFRAEFSAMSLNEKEKQQFGDVYRDRYGISLADSFLARVKTANPDLNEEFGGYVRAKDDGRQTMFEMTGRNAESGGLVLDATGLVQEKSLQDYKATVDKYQALLQKLPPEVQNAMTQYYSEATKQYIDSKKDLTELAKNAVFVAAAIAAIPVTAGLSTATMAEMIPALAAAGAAGAGTNAAIEKMVMGGDANIDFNTYLNGALSGLLTLAPLPKIPRELPAGELGAGLRTGEQVGTDTAAAAEKAAAEKAAAEKAAAEKAAAEKAAAEKAAAEKAAAEKAAAEKAAAEKAAAEKAAAEKAAAEKAAAEKAAAEKAAAEKAAAEKAAAEKAAAEKAAAEKAAAEKAAAEKAAAEKAAAEKAAAEKAAAEKAAAEKAAAEKAAAEKAAAEKAAAEKAAAEKAAAEKAAAEKAAAEKAAVEKAAVEKAAAEKAAAEKAAAEKAAAEKAAAEKAAAEKAAAEKAATEKAAAEKAAAEKAAAEKAAAEKAAAEKAAAEKAAAENAAAEKAAAEKAAAEKAAAEKAAAEKAAAEKAAAEKAAAEKVAAEKAAAEKAAAEKAAAEKAAAEKAAAEKAAAEKAAAEKAAAEKAAAEKAVAEKAAAEKAAAEKAAAEKAAAEKAAAIGVAAGADHFRDLTPSATLPDNKPAVPSDALINLATVKNWEGPYHSADRILRAVLGRTPTMDEVHSMTRALQEEFKLEHGGKSVTEAGLARGYQWINKDNFQGVLNQMQGAPGLQAQLKAFVDNSNAVPANIPSQKAYPSAPQPARAHHHAYR